MIIELQHISKTFGTLNVLEDITTTFKAGYVYCIVGENGSGKTTLLNLIGGQSRPSTGEIRYGGKVFSRPDPAKLAQIGIGRLFQKIRLFENMTVLDNVLVGFQKQLGESIFLSLVKPFSRNAEGLRLQRMALDLLKTFGIEDLANQEAATLSLGQSKLVALARLAAAQPDVFLLDEPTAGLSENNKKLLINWLEIQKESGKCIVVIEHGDAIASEIGDNLQHLQAGCLHEVHACSP